MIPLKFTYLGIYMAYQAMWLLSGTAYRSPGYIALHYIVLVRNYEVKGFFPLVAFILFIYVRKLPNDGDAELVS
jgi:hypothetical protein